MLSEGDIEGITSWEQARIQPSVGVPTMGSPAPARNTKAASLPAGAPGGSGPSSNHDIQQMTLMKDSSQGWSKGRVADIIAGISEDGWLT